MSVKIGFVGCGDISGIYFRNILERFQELEIAGICDLIDEKAQNRSKEFGGLHIYKDMYEIFADPSVDIVLNITRPNDHYGVSKAALEAGKHVYCEKPLAATLEQGRELVALAKEKGLMLGGAPDTFLGAGIQGCRKLIEGGVIGTPVGCTARMICHGHETWHPDPEFYYKEPGGGPMLDMGPYYITALVNLLGPVQSVMGMVKTEFQNRTITSKKHYGAVIDVDCPTYEMGLLRFQSGAIGHIFTTFDVYSMNAAATTESKDVGAMDLPCIEIYGTQGNLTVPDPNGFGGQIKIKLGGGWNEAENAYHTYTSNCRALGLADMAKAIETGRPPRASAQHQTLHVLEILRAFRLSCQTGKEVAIEAAFELQPPMPVDARDGILD
jgi:predicted dehydrogenase